MKEKTCTFYVANVKEEAHILCRHVGVGYALE